MAENQISAHVSESTRRMVDEFAAAHGVKKGFLVESALLHHLQALRELPADVIIPPRVAVTRRSMETVADLLGGDAEPTPAMRELMSDG